MKITRNFNGVFVNGFDNILSLMREDEETKRIFGEHYYTYSHNGSETQLPTLSVRGDDGVFHEHIVDVYLFKHHRDVEGFNKIKKSLLDIKKFFRGCFTETEEYFSVDDDDEVDES